MRSAKNKVDFLFEEVKKIQEKCCHTFFLLGVYKPKETMVKKVFRVEKGVTACCIDCSRVINIDMTKMCPRCFGEMVRQEESKGSIDQLYSCKTCKYTVHQLGELE